MTDRVRSHEIASDDQQYTETWARDILAAVGKREARRILADYRKIADDPRVRKKSREIAKERADNLEESI